MQTAIATVSLSGTLNEKLQAIAAAQFKSVELYENDLLSFNGSPRDVARMVADLGLKIVTFQPFRDFEGSAGAQRVKAFSRAERKFDVMEELGCELLMVCSNVSPDALGGIDRLAADFHELGARAASRSMRIGFEALAWGRHLNDYRDAWEVVRRADHASVGLVLDSFHTLVRNTDLTAMRAIPKDRIALVQIADAPRLDMDYLSLSRHYRCFPGQGEFAIGEFMIALQATGYDGLLSLEIFNDRFRAGSVYSVAVDGHRSLINMLDQLSQSTGVSVPGQAHLPPRATCNGIEFVEFAMDEAIATSFETALGGLGFALTGTHKTKAVNRWSQGDINLLVNQEKEGFAHSFNITHGSSVCAIALKVDDAQAAIARAVDLLDQPFTQAVGPGELDIPAVRGVGGSLLYFIDQKSGLTKLWDVDFVGTRPAHRSAGLVGLDHLSQSMQYEEMLNWLLFYTSLLDVVKTPTLDVLDPGGIVQSQVIQNASGSFRLALNGSQSRQTLSSRFLSELFGSGVQHIALASADIFATVATLRANGVELLPIPANYYDDLDARADLSTAQLQRLRDNNILYDRDGEAEFFQIYTGNLLEGGFFFEIVERRNYKGFGAVNAPIRLAAQTRLAPLATIPRH